MTHTYGKPKRNSGKNAELKMIVTHVSKEKNDKNEWNRCLGFAGLTNWQRTGLSLHEFDRNKTALEDYVYQLNVKKLLNLAMKLFWVDREVHLC